MVRFLRVGAVSGAALMAAGVFVPAAATAAPSSTPMATVRMANLSPDIASVDVYLTGLGGGATTRLWVSGEQYGGVSHYQAIRAGSYFVIMKPQGAGASTPATLTWTLNAQPGGAYTAATVGAGANHKGAVLTDDLTPPTPGKARVRLIQAASGAPKADLVAVKGPVLAQNASFATSTGYAQVPAGTWPLLASSTSDPSLNATASVSVQSGSVNSIVLLDKAGGGLRLSAVLDAAGAALAPRGAVPAGGGGTAATLIDSEPSTGTAVRTLTWTSLVGLLVAAAVGRRRWVRRSMA